jgi:hypothetical protein
VQIVPLETRVVSESTRVPGGHGGPVRLGLVPTIVGSRVACPVEMGFQSLA